MDNAAGKVVIHAPSGETAIKLALSRAAVAKVQVAGVDLVLVMSDGTQHVLQGAALRALADPDFKLQFQDGDTEASTLITQAGPVNITDTLLRTIEKNTTADDTPEPAAREGSSEMAPPPKPAAESGMVSGTGGGEAPPRPSSTTRHGLSRSSSRSRLGRPATQAAARRHRRLRPTC